MEILLLVVGVFVLAQMQKPGAGPIVNNQPSIQGGPPGGAKGTSGTLDKISQGLDAGQKIIKDLGSAWDSVSGGSDPGSMFNW